LKKLLYVLIALVVVLVGAVLVGPSLVDWNTHKDRIAAEVRKQTGRAFSIEGEVGLSVVPVPALSLGEVSLANLQDGSPEPMVALKALKVRVAVLPLLRGKIQVERISLVEPRILLEVLPDGRRNWDFGGPEAEGAPAGGEGEGGGMEVQLDDFSIESGTLVYRDLAAGSEERVDGLDARIVAASLRGPFEAKGKARLRGVETSFEAAVGRLVEEGATPISLLLGLAATPAEAQFSGALSFHPGATSLRGRFKVEGEDLAATAAVLSVQTPATLAQTYLVQGELTVDPEMLSLAELEGRLGDMEVTGEVSAASAAPYDARVSLSTRRIDLDRLLAEASRSGGAEEPANEATADPAAEMKAWALPSDVAGRVELTADALVYRGELVRQLRVEAALADGRLTLEQGTALLPGSSDVSVTGELAGSEAGPRFDGRAEAASNSLRGLFAWLGVAVESVPPDRLRRMNFSARIEASPEQVALHDLDLSVDLTRVTGGMIVALRERPGLGVGLLVDTINLEAYLPEPAREVGEQAGEQAGGAEQPVADNALAFLNDFDANVNLRVGAVTFRGETAKDLRLEATLQRGDLDLRTARVGNLAGGSAGYTGRVLGLADSPALDGTVELEVAEPSRLARLLDLAPEDLDAVPPFRAEVRLEGPLDELGVDGQVTALGGAFALAGLTQLGAAAPGFDLRVTARHPEVVGLAESLVGSLPLDPGLGALDLSGRIAGSPTEVRVSDLAGSVGPAGLSGGFDLDLSGAAPGLRGLELGLALRHPDLAALARDLGAEVALGPGLGALDLNGTLRGELENFRIEELSGTAGPARLSGAVALDLSGLGAPLRDLDLALAVAHPDAGQLAAALGGPTDLPADLGAVELSGQLRGSGDTFRLEGLTGSIGPATLAGDLSADLSGPRPAIAANLETGPVSLDAWLAGAAGDGEGGGAAPDEPRWSREPIDLGGLQAFDADLNVKSEALIKETLRLDGAILEAVLEDGVLDVQRFAGTLYGGAVQLAGRLDARGVPEAGFGVTALEVDLGALLREQADFDRVSGPISLNADLTTRGGSMAELVSALGGRGNVSGLLTARAKSGEKAGSLLLDIIGTQVAQVRGLADATGLLFNAFADAPATLTGTFTVDHGVAQTRDTRLDGQAAYALVTGTVDLPAWQLNALNEVYVPQAPQSAYLTVTLSGPLDEPDWKLGGDAIRGQGLGLPLLQQPTIPLLQEPATTAPSGPTPTGPQPTGSTTTTTTTEPASPTTTTEPAPSEPVPTQPEDLLQKGIEQGIEKLFGG
jgi:uncharacterized protein involved in outer membrane biogenesis